MIEPIVVLPEEVDAPDRSFARLPPRPKTTVIVTLAVRLSALLAIHIHSHLVGEAGFNAFPYGGLDDGRYYYTTGQQLADGITPPYVLNAFPRILAVIMDLGIRDLLALKLISFAISSIAVVVMASIAWHLSTGMAEAVRRWTVIVASVLGSLFPSNVFWTTNSLMRDGWILTFVVVAIWSFSGAAPTVLTRSRWLLGLLALAAATSFRPYVLPIFVAAFISSRFEFLNPMMRLKPRVGAVVVRLGLLALGFMVLCLAVAPFLTDLTGFNILSWRSQEQLLGKGSSMNLRFDDVNAATAVQNYFISVVSNAVGPLPFQIRSANQMLAFVEFPFFVIIAAGLFKANYSDRLLRFCALFGLYWLLLLGLWNDVLGNGARNRIMAWPILAIAAAPAIAHYLAARFDGTETGLRLRTTRRSRGGRRGAKRREAERRTAESLFVETEPHDLFTPVTPVELVRSAESTEDVSDFRWPDHDRRSGAERRSSARRILDQERDRQKAATNIIVVFESAEEAAEFQAYGSQPEIANGSGQLALQDPPISSDAEDQ